MVGKTFAHYVILEKAGAGGMGVVYRAHDEKLHRDVALKLPAMDSLTNEEARSRILREGRAASALNHPNICTIYEVGEVDGQPYIAMEYVPGETLSKRIPAERAADGVGARPWCADCRCFGPCRTRMGFSTAT